MSCGRAAGRWVGRSSLEDPRSGGGYPFQVFLLFLCVFPSRNERYFLSIWRPVTRSGLSGSMQAVIGPAGGVDAGTHCCSCTFYVWMMIIILSQRTWDPPHVSLPHTVHIGMFRVRPVRSIQSDVTHWPCSCSPGPMWEVKGQGCLCVQIVKPSEGNTSFVILCYRKWTELKLQTMTEPHAASNYTSVRERCAQGSQADLWPHHLQPRVTRSWTCLSPEHTGNQPDNPTPPPLGSVTVLRVLCNPI